jgi:hypothetical protein
MCAIINTDGKPIHELASEPPCHAAEKEGDQLQNKDGRARRRVDAAASRPLISRDRHHAMPLTWWNP